MFGRRFYSRNGVQNHFSAQRLDPLKNVAPAHAYTFKKQNKGQVGRVKKVAIPLRDCIPPSESGFLIFFAGSYGDISSV